MIKKEKDKFSIIVRYSVIFGIFVALASWNLFWGLAACMSMLVIFAIEDSLANIDETLKKIAKRK